MPYRSTNELGRQTGCKVDVQGADRGHFLFFAITIEQSVMKTCIVRFWNVILSFVGLLIVLKKLMDVQHYICHFPNNSGSYYVVYKIS